MRQLLMGLAWMMAAATPAWAAPDAAEQAQFESFVVAAGASNGAARACGASEPDLAQHEATSRKNLERYAKEYGFSASGYDGLYQKGLSDGTTMMEEMKRSGVDGCRGAVSYTHLTLPTKA